MIIITNGERIFSVTQGAYDSIYEPLGWKKVNEPLDQQKSDFKTSENSEVKLNTEEVIDTPEDNFVQESDDEEINSENLSEIPLTDMTSSQLRAYAKELGVDIKGVKSKKVVIERIRAVL